MKLTENQIRRIVRKVIAEQVNYTVFQDCAKFQTLTPQEEELFYGDKDYNTVHMDNQDVEPHCLFNAFDENDMYLKHLNTSISIEFKRRAAEEYRALFDVNDDGSGSESDGYDGYSDDFNAHSGIMDDLIDGGIPDDDAEETAYRIIRGDY